MSVLRNIFAFEDEAAAWKEELSKFPNHVPRFAEKQQAIDFTKKHCLVHSNPDHPNLQHSITTLVEWKQIEEILLPKIKEYEQRWPASPAGPPPAAAAPMDPLQASVHEYAKSRLDLPIHAEMSDISRMNTLRYLFFHMKCGIYVMIRRGRLAVFCPFVNKDYRNTWGDELRIDSSDGTVESYIEEKSAYFPAHSLHLLGREQWWANGNIICNDYGGSEEEENNQYWGDHFLLQLKDMLSELCRCRAVTDADFFINKRDYPQLKYNPSLGPVEPYGFIFDRDDRDPAQDLPLRREQHSSYAPILSFYSSQRFADIPIPPTEDWEVATGAVYPASFKYSSTPSGVEVAAPRDLFTPSNLARFACAWEDKLPTAFFRGTATGGGTTAASNQRLALAQLCWDWSTSSAELSGYLDAKITGWNQRDKKTPSAAMTYIRNKAFKFDGDRRRNFVEIYKQSTYKYLIYAEGHCAACRYGFMMQLGSVILKVESLCVADSMWYFPLLRPYEDHVPVKADLSDLREVLDWCRSHDEECKRIAQRAKELHARYLGREGILDYLQGIVQGISARWLRLPQWAAQAAKEMPKPVLPLGHTVHSCAEGADQLGVTCSYCQQKALQLRKEEDEAKAKQMAAKGAAAGQKGGKKSLLRDRMKKVATTSAAKAEGSELGKRSREHEEDDDQEKEV